MVEVSEKCDAKYLIKVFLTENEVLIK